MKTAVYYFPNYHADSRNESFHGKGWTEWELMKNARPRFVNHDQPKIPLWGYENEADPAVMAKKVDAAADHGIDAFVFDWYWYDGPYLQRALDEGYLGAANRSRLQFALMWANHDWYDRHPIGFTKSATADKLYTWSTTKESISFVWDYVIERYLTRPEYWRVDGKPYFSIYAVNRFIAQMGGLDDAAEALALFQEKAKAAGLSGVHLNAVWYHNLDNKPFCVCPQKQWHGKIGFDSYTSYNSIGTTMVWETDFPFVEYAKAADEYVTLAQKAQKNLPAPYYPVLTAGWDTTPRTIQSEVYRSGPYPYLPIMQPEPEAFRLLLKNLKGMLRLRSESEQILFINAWNEWTEGSYLEPDTKNHYTYLEILKEELQK